MHCTCARFQTAAHKFSTQIRYIGRYNFIFVIIKSHQILNHKLYKTGWSSSTSHDDFHYLIALIKFLFRGLLYAVATMSFLSSFMFPFTLSVCMRKLRRDVTLYPLLTLTFSFNRQTVLPIYPIVYVYVLYRICSSYILGTQVTCCISRHVCESIHTYIYRYIGRVWRALHHI